MKSVKGFRVLLYTSSDDALYLYQVCENIAKGFRATEQT